MVLIGNNFVTLHPEMCNLDKFVIDLKALASDDACRTFELDDTFFGAVGGEDVEKGMATAELHIRRVAEGCFDLHFRVHGEVTVLCDRCLDEMSQSIDTEASLVVKYGDEYSEEDDYVTIPESEGTVDVAWFIYEFIVLALPIKHVHAPGKCNRAMIDMLNEHSATRSSDGNAQESIDPRWIELLKLKESKD